MSASRWKNYDIFMTLNVIITRKSLICGRNSVVECQLPKLKVAGSNPVARSNKINNLGDFQRREIY